METINVNALHGLTVEAIKQRLAELNKDQLEQLRAIEVANGEEKARSTLLTAIDARLEALAGEAGSDGASGAEGNPDSAGVGQADGSTGSEVGTPQTSEPAPPPADDLQAVLAAEREKLEHDAEIEAAAADLRDRSVAVARENAVRLFGEARELLGNLDARDALVDGAELYFSEGESFLAGMDAVRIRPGQLHVEGGRLIVNEAIDFPPMAPSARIEAVWLHSLGDWAMTRLMQPLVIGGGHEARLPAGHLAFAVN